VQQAYILSLHPPSYFRLRPLTVGAANTRDMRAPAPQTFPKWESLKNKLQIHVTFFAPKNVAVKSPHSPRKTPQIHHQNTTFCHPFFLQNPQQKHKKPTPKKIRYILLAKVTDYPEVYGITSVAVAKLS
jgi:hypothetical protein